MRTRTRVVSIHSDKLSSNTNNWILDQGALFLGYDESDLSVDRRVYRIPDRVLPELAEHMIRVRGWWEAFPDTPRDKTDKVNPWLMELSYREALMSWGNSPI